MIGLSPFRASGIIVSLNPLALRGDWQVTSPCNIHILYNK